MRCGVRPHLARLARLARLAVLAPAFTLALAAIGASPAHADDRADHRVRVFSELDPLTFANLGYGVQVGIRHPALRGLRLAVASFSLHVPDVIAQLGGNDGFDLRVRPSAALYALYYFAPPGRDGLAIGGSLRYLRPRYQHEDVPGAEVTVGEVSPEVIVGYQWHPLHNGFYLQPWFALGVVVAHDGEPTVGAHTYDELPVIPFFTVNVGWELAL